MRNKEKAALIHMDTKDIIELVSSYLERQGLNLEKNFGIRIRIKDRAISDIYNVTLYSEENEIGSVIKEGTLEEIGKIFDYGFNP